MQTSSLIGQIGNARNTTVLMTTEGTYPFHEGGVSTWCDILIRQLPDINFSLLSLTALPGGKVSYKLPSNVVSYQELPLWGTTAVNELRKEIGWRELHMLRRHLTRPESKMAFSDAFALLLRGLMDEKGTVENVRDGLALLTNFFVDHDFDSALRHPIAWSIFQQQVKNSPSLWTDPVFSGSVAPKLKPDGERVMPSVIEVAEGLRLLYRWLTTIAVPVPKVDLVHATASGLASLPGIAAKLQHGTPLLITEHGVYLRERFLAWTGDDMSPFIKRFASRVMRRFVEVSYTYADMISPVSSWNSRWEQRLGATPERIFPIANGVDPDKFAPKPMPPRDKPTLVWVGRIDPLKDVITLLEAMAIVVKSVPNFQLLIFGKAPLGNEVYDALCRKRWSELKLEECVHFMGFAPSPQEAYVQGHAVVLSSISEAMPYSVIEAMCCGRPVIGTAVGGVPEVISDTGAVVNPRDPAELAEACIQMLLNLDVCEMLGDAARDRALTSYSLRGFLTSYRSLYDLAAPAPVVADTWLTSVTEVSGKKMRDQARLIEKSEEKVRRRPVASGEESPTGLKRILGTISAILPSW